jgi:hypothetical protein
MCERPEQRLVTAAQGLAEAEHHLEELVRGTDERWIRAAITVLHRREDYRALRLLEKQVWEPVEGDDIGAREMVER